MSRKSFQRVTLSVELTLPPGAKAKDAPAFIKQAMQLRVDSHGRNSVPLSQLRVEQAIIKIIKRETIYTN